MGITEWRLKRRLTLVGNKNKSIHASSQGTKCQKSIIFISFFVAESDTQ